MLERERSDNFLRFNARIFLESRVTYSREATERVTTIGGVTSSEVCSEINDEMKADKSEIVNNAEVQVNVTIRTVIMLSSNYRLTKQTSRNVL